VPPDAIDAVDWSSIPNPTSEPWDEPEGVARALRLLAGSTAANETGDAASLLAGRGFVCGHAGMVFPAAYAAAPVLLDLVENGRRPRIKEAALGLLADALGCLPPAGHGRVDTPYGTGVPLCCAIARLVRGRRSVLLGHRKYGRRLVADAELHWWMSVEEAEVHFDGTVTALVALEGAPFKTPVDAEVYGPLAMGPASVVRIDALTVDASGAACVRLARAPSEILVGAALCPAECGLREH